ncbi:unnamed protein product [Owenia fusiformis]|uniref:Uncharacterized protein n=1 Tax=Owenia fusiformis TaxID=6347 RepID=A0A8J1UV67_OWEFU|nr:unnamed protein product [Owenia fusiformis]
MAAQQRVQDYLKKHKIGALFEELMAKVIDKMPEEPVPYIIRVLQRKYGLSESDDFGQVRRSTGEYGDTFGVAKEKASYDKPWKTNSKRLKPKKSEDVENKRPAGGMSQSNEEWDSNTKTKSQNFDELFTETQQKKTAAIKKQTANSTSKNLWRTEAEDHDFTYQSSGYTGPRRAKTGEDSLASELIVTHSSRTKEDPIQTAAVTSGSKRKGQAVDAHKHRKKLEEMILSEQKAQDSGYYDEREEKDDALEVLENAGDLESEGISISKGQGVKVSRSQRRSPDEKVKVSICAMCAKVMSGQRGPQPSEPAMGTRFGELPDFDYETDRDFPSRPQSSVRYTPTPPSDVEDFESVSQVTGPRRPVWHNEDSDADTITPRKGTHMFSKVVDTDQHPEQPMYAGTRSPMSPKRATGTPSRSRSPGRNAQLSGTLPLRSVDMRSSYSNTQVADDEKSLEFMRKTWSPNTHSFDTEDEGRNMATPDILSKRTKGWQIPADDSDTSSVDWDKDGNVTGLKRHKPKTKSGLSASQGSRSGRQY